MAWSLAAIEFVAWSVLKEDGSGEEVADKALEQACRANPFVAWNIAHREIFDEVKKGGRGEEGTRAGGGGGGWHLSCVAAVYRACMYSMWNNKCRTWMAELPSCVPV